MNQPTLNDPLSSLRREDLLRLYEALELSREGLEEWGDDELVEFVCENHSRAEIEDAVSKLDEDPGSAAQPGSTSFKGRVGEFFRTLHESRPLGFWVGVLGTLVTVLSFGLYLADSRERSDNWPSREPTPAVGVLLFHNGTSSEDWDWVGEALPAMIHTQLRSHPDGVAVGVWEIPTGLPLARFEERAPPGELRQLARRLGVSYLLAGSYQVSDPSQGGEVSVRYWLYDGTSGRPLSTAGARATQVALPSLETDSAARLWELSDRIARRVRQAAGAPQPTAQQQAEAEGLFPHDFSEVRALFTAVDQRHRYRNDLARITLTALAQEDGRSPLVALEEATLLEELGDPQADESAARALRLAGRVDGPLWQEVRAKSHLLRGEWQAASRLLAPLVDQRPYDVTLALDLVDAFFQSGKRNDSEALIERLEELPQPFEDDPRIPYRKARIASDAGRFQAALESASEALRRAKETVAPLLGARAALLRANAFEGRREFPEMTRAAQESITLLGETEIPPATRQLQKATAQAWRSLGFAKGQLGSPARAEEYLAGALRIFRDIDEPRGVDSVTSAWLALGLANVPEPVAVAVAPEDLDHRISQRNAEGIAHLEGGDLASAAHSFREALGLVSESDNPANRAIILTNLGETYYLSGRLAEAEARHRESLRLNRSLDPPNPEAVGYDLFRLALVLEALGHSEEAMDAYEEASTFQRASSQPCAAAESKTRRARLLLTAGGAGEIAQEEAPAVDCGQASFLTARADLLLARGDAEQSLEEAQRAKAALTAGAGIWERLSLETTLATARARLAPADGNGASQASEAISQLQRIASESLAHGLKIHELEARLAAAEAAAATGEHEEIANEIELIVQEAERLQLGSIAQRARS